MNEKEELSLMTLYNRLKDEKEILNSKIKDEINFFEIMEEYELVKKEITFINCEIGSIISPSTIFFKPFTLKNCILHHASFSSNSFREGLIIDNCEILSNVTFEAGGHNKIDKPIKLLNSKFHGVIDFFDCWFQGPVEIINCEFIKGTNLLGNKGEPFEVGFDFKPTINSNEGRLDLNQIELIGKWAEKIGILPSEFYKKYVVEFPNTFNKFPTISYNNKLSMNINSPYNKNVWLRIILSKNEITIKINKHVSQRFKLEADGIEQKPDEIKEISDNAIRYIHQIFNDEIIIEKSLLPWKGDVLKTYYKKDLTKCSSSKTRKYTWTGRYKGK